MKTKKYVKASLVLSTVLILFLTSCNEENKLSLQDTQDINEEALTDSYFQDMDDMAGVALQAPAEDEYSGGRTKTTVVVNDNRFKCDGDPVLVTIERDETSTIESPKGIITVDFGTTGCTDLRNNTRTGKLIFDYNGKRFTPGATIITTTENYTINGVELEGVRTLTNVSESTSDSPQFNAVLTNGKAIFEDGSIAERESNITWSWIRAANPSDDQLIIAPTSIASGTTKGGRDYQVSLLEQLVYKRFCGIAVSGIKKYVLGPEKEVIIDYGDGTCDREMTVTINGETRTIRLN